MICEKCGKKVSDRKTYCDYCKNPVVYSGFSRLEYEKTPTPITPITSAAPPVTGRTDAGTFRAVAPPKKKKGSAMPIVAVIVVLVAVVAIICFVAPGFMDKDKPAKDTISQTKPDSDITNTNEESEKVIESIKITNDAKILVYDGNSTDPRYDYELVIKKGEKVTTEGLSIISLVFEEIVLQEEIKYITDAKTVANIDELATGDIYRIIVTDINDRSISKEIEVVVVETDGKDEICIELDVDESETGKAENPTKPYLGILATCGGNDKYMLYALDNEGVSELVVKRGKEYTVYVVEQGTADKIYSFVADELIENHEGGLFYHAGDEYFEMKISGCNLKEDYDPGMGEKIPDNWFVSVSDTSKIDNYNKEK